jgi:hypothetical protein
VDRSVTIPAGPVSGSPRRSTASHSCYRRIPTLRLAADLDDIPFKHDGFVYGVHELPVAW